MQIICGVLVVLFAADYANAILSNEPWDITRNPKFNCRWFGGSDNKLECNCLNGNEVFNIYPSRSNIISSLLQEYIIKENSIPYDVYAINITHCGKIVMRSNAITTIRHLRILTLDNIGDIELHENSLYWIGNVRSTENIVDLDPAIPSMKLRISHSRISDLSNNAIKGRIRQIEFINCDIQHMAPFALSNLQQSYEVLIDGTIFHNLDPQSFKKFTTSQLIIRNSIFHTIPSRAFFNLTVRNLFVMDNVTIRETLKPSGFIVNNPHKFELTNSRIHAISGDGFKLVMRGNVLIKDNVFNNTGIGAFRGISLNKDEMNSYATISFERNVFHNLSKDALSVNSEDFKAQYVNVRVSELCECGKLERYFRNDENTLEVNCLDDTNSWLSVDKFRKNRCGLLDTKIGTAYIIGIVCAIALIIVISTLAFYFWRMNQQKTYGGSSTDKNGKLSMIVPDGRTYRETELHVIVERADLLTTDL